MKSQNLLIPITRAHYSAPVLTGLRLLAVGAAMNSAFCAATPNLESNIARPLRYHPEGTDFVIENGGEFFNRPLYGNNTAFRVDAGDKPEFVLYLPGRGGNLRVALKNGGSVKWLFDAARITTRYRPGSMIYEIRDPILGENALLRLTAIPSIEVQGLILRAEMQGNTSGAELVYVYGGVSGERGDRNGDIGCEKVPVGEFFQFKPESCKGNEITVRNGAFTLRSKPATICGSLSASGATITLADATKWSSLAELLSVAGKSAVKLPVVVTEVPLKSGVPLFFALLRAEEPTPFELPQLFEQAERHRQKIAQQVVVDTPDPFINAAAAALCVAADGVWDAKQKAFMHGAVAWRTRLLGWRGAYAGDELGWHDRTVAHLEGFAKQQNAEPIPDSLPPPDEKSNLARSEAALHSNGDLSKSHYDMNLVAVDAFLRHLLWTGDVDVARQMWPAIERHFAWERRLFRREFGDDKVPLYEAYAAIWASDNLNYNGGGTAHASAYNYFANKMAARVAKRLDKDPRPYEEETGFILRGMNQYLWLAGEGNFGESKDWLGLQLVHPNSGLWTFYHTVDSEVPTPQQAWQMSRWIDNHIAHIPIRGAGVPDERLFTLPETSWMPYQWSLNNVVMAEAAHTALGFWQANRPAAAFSLFKGELLDSMFLGLCPGNFGCMTPHDMARGEAQRDFGDAIGVNSRALVEGLFGVKPDALAGELKIAPGFPAKWEHASIHHPDFDFDFRRDGLTEMYLVEPKFPKPMKVNLQIVVLRTVPEVTVNGLPAKWNWVDDLFGVRRIEIKSPAAEKQKVVVNWIGESPSEIAGPEVATAAPEKVAAFDWSQKAPDSQKYETVNLASLFNAKVTQIFRNEYRTPRSPFASLATPSHGIGGWCAPTAGFDVDDAGLREVAARNNGIFNLPNGIPFATPGTGEAKNIAFTSQWDNYPREVTVPLSGASSHAFLLMAGSTAAMQSQFDNGEVVVTYADGSSVKLTLRNPTNWWPIEQDYFIDDYAFRRPEPIPPRVDLKTGKVRILDVEKFKGKGRKVDGGAATVLDLPLDKAKELKSLTVHALANEVVIGLMSVTLAR